MNRLALVLVVTLLGAASAPTPLLVGSVRDQYGVPVVGALVAVPSNGGSLVVAQTDDDGTFALENITPSGLATITCRYCEPTHAGIAADGTLVAVVHRYDALEESIPTARDLEHVPYAHAETAVSLAPFTMLTESTSALPGSQISDRGAPARGGLLIADDIPNYDIVANLSPYYTLPERSISQVLTRPGSQAYRYGDVADGGTFLTRATTSDPALHALADSAGANVHDADESVAFSADRGDERARASVHHVFATQTSTLDLSVSSGEGHVEPTTSSGLQTSFSGVSLGFQRRSGVDLSSRLTVDRGTYATSGSLARVDAAWSDWDARVEVRSHATLAPFVLFDARSSSGFYWPHHSAVPRIAAVADQAQFVTGASYHSARYDALLAAGAADIAYSGGYSGAAPAAASASSGVLQLQFHPNDRWALETSTTTGYRLPTFLERYGIVGQDDSVTFDHDQTLEATLSYTDTSRVRASVTALHRRTSGLHLGALGTIGAAFAWQVAPRISVRSWVMRTSSGQAPYEPLLSLNPASTNPATVGSAWLTYEPSSRVRVDAIWRRDIVDQHPDAHFDAAFSSVLSGESRWFVSSERWLGRRSITAGIRW